MRSPVGVVRCVCSCVLLCAVASHAAAQDPVYDVNGAQRGRAYFATLPWEAIDTVTGNVVLSFTDLALPGDAGSGLSVVRTYNSRDGVWRFGIAGAPLKLVFKPPANDLSNIDFVTPDGATHNATGAAPITYTTEFWAFTKATFTLEMPNGTVAIYGHLVPGVGRYLTEVKDPFDNRLTLAWQPTIAVLDSVTQYVGQGHTRVVTFSGWVSERPNSFSYDGKTWTYAWETMTALPEAVQALKTFTPPAGGTWTFTYETDTAGGVKVKTVKTINGGTITYTWGPETFPTTPEERIAIQTRAQGGGVPNGTWTFDWLEKGTILEVTGPANRVRFEPVKVSGYPLAGRTIVSTTGGTTLRTEQLTYAAAEGPAGYFPLLKRREVTQNGQTFATYFEHSPDAYSNYGHPVLIAEVGDFTRNTTITYKHDFSKYIRARVLSRTTTVAGAGPTIASTTTYDGSNGFVLSTTALGRTTLYTNDGRGNVASATYPNGGQSHFTYDWGVLKTAEDPVGLTMTRVLNADGTVASETAAGVTTTFGYDAIGRVVSASVPGLATATTTYQVAGGSWTGTATARGSVSLQTDLDGFGRPVHTTDGAGAQSRTTYDADGRVIYASYPFGGGVSEAGDTYEYDALGRPTKITRADGSTVATSYSGGSVQVTERIAPGQFRTTTRLFKAFGDPSDARMTRFTDAAGMVWAYTYDALGHVTVMDTATGGLTGGFKTSQQRIWQYDSQGNLTQEFHPESRDTKYTHDAMGNVLSREDMRGPSVKVLYAYDAAGRLTSVNAPGTLEDTAIAYTSTGAVASVTNGTVQTAYGYDGLGRMTSRTDTMSGRSFAQAFAYDAESRLTAHTYPSGHIVTYTYGTQSRLTAVRIQPPNGAQQTLAGSFAYHPSGKVLSYQFGNGQTRAITVDARQRPLQWQTGPLRQTYAYDDVNNVKTITDDTRPQFSAAYQYDVLDRLTTVTGYGATSFTYDPAGNRLTAGTVTYHYQCCTQDKLMSLSGGQSGTFTYTAHGSVLSDPTGAAYTYSALNRMTSATLGGQTTAYRYDGDGQRAVKVGPDGVEHYFIRNGSTLIAEYYASGADTVLARQYVYGPDGLLAAFAPDSATLPPVSVAIVTPTPGQTFANGQTVTLTATVTAGPGVTVARVEYYQGGLLVGQATSAPYQVSWNNLPLAPGPFTFIARVVTTDNRAVASSPVAITVN